MQTEPTVERIDQTVYNYSPAAIRRLIRKDVDERRGPKARSSMSVTLHQVEGGEFLARVVVSELEEAEPNDS